MFTHHNNFSRSIGNEKGENTHASLDGVKQLAAGHHGIEHWFRKIRAFKLLSRS